MEDLLDNETNSLLLGSFIVVCFAAWVVWRMIKKSKQRKRGSVTPTAGRFPKREGGRFGSALIAKIPWVRDRWGTGWRRFDDDATLAPSYEKGMSSDLDPGYFAPTVKPIPAGTVPMGGLGLDTSVGNIPMSQAQTMTVSPTSTMLVRTNTLGTMNTINMTSNGSIAPSVMMVVPGHQANQSFSSMQAYANADEATLRSGMGAGVYYNQSELARNPSEAYDPARRQVNRASVLSSLSSGFGDGDIIVAAAGGGGAAAGGGIAPAPLLPRIPPAASQPLRTSANLVGRFSWANQSNRETVYTETSEDSPPRFRTISSWVNQQTGRIRRAQTRAEEEGDVPPMPGMPPEPQYNMMMPDDEVPRRVDVGPLNSHPSPGR